MTLDLRHIARGTGTARRSVRRVVMPLVVLATVLASACAGEHAASRVDDGAAAAPTENAEDAEAPSWLFTIQAQDTATFDTSTSTLSLPATSVQAFTDRPFRDTRTMSPQQFEGLWDGLDDDSFTDDPPNAVLTYWEGDGLSGTPRTVVCEIDRDAGYRLADGSFHFGIRPLDPADAVIPAQLHGASLFVDSVGDVSSGGGCPPTPEQQASIESVMSMNQSAVQLAVNDTGTRFEVMLVCDPRVEQTGLIRVSLGAAGNPQTGCEDVPYTDVGSADFMCGVAGGGASSVLTCDGHAIVIDKQQLKQKRYPECSNGTNCTWELTFGNPTTGAAYATSPVTVQIHNGNQYLYPDLHLTYSPSC